MRKPCCAVIFVALAGPMAGCGTEEIQSQAYLPPAASTEPPAVATPDAGRRAPAADAGPAWTTPEPSSSHGPCVISADCPAGQHCDLGECVQACNTATPCGGGLVCSPRARCLQPGEPDRDPPPTSAHEGTVAADPPSVSLTERDKGFQITLRASSQAAVRYRVQLDAPHLRIAQPRGTFTGSAPVAFAVDTGKLQAATSAGASRSSPRSAASWSTPRSTSASPAPTTGRCATSRARSRSARRASRSSSSRRTAT